MNNIKLDLYKIFAKVMESGSQAAASKDLFITQSAISQAIAQLETQLDTKLFTKSKKGMTPTYYGNILYEYIKEGFKYFLLGEEKLLNIKNLMQGELIIACNNSLAGLILEKKISSYIFKYGNVGIQIKTFEIKEIFSKLKNCEIDIAFVNKNALQGENIIQKSFPVNYILIEQKDENYLIDENIFLKKNCLEDTLKNIKFKRIIVAENELFLFLKKQEFLKNIIIDLVDSAETLCSLVQKGLAVGILPQNILHYDRKRIRETPLIIDESINEYILINNKNNILSSLALAFINA